MNNEKFKNLNISIGKSENEIVLFLKGSFLIFSSINGISLNENVNENYLEMKINSIGFCSYFEINTETSVNECKQCKFGKNNQNECKLIENKIDNCISYSNNGNCFTCEEKFYFDSKKKKKILFC